MNTIHPSAIIGPNVTMGEGNTIGPFAVLAGTIRLGNHNWIGSGVKLGVPPEVRSFGHDEDWLELPEGAGLVIGDGNVIREDAQIHSGWHAATRVGNDAFLMNQVYIAHDCDLRDGVTLASGVAIGGHSHIGRGANLGLGTTVHQRRVIGALAMVGMSSVVTKDIPPFVKAYGSPCRIHGINAVGMDRAGLSEAVVERVTAALAAAALLDTFDSTDAAYADIEWFRQATA